jgi:hypothetical protein
VVVEPSTLHLTVPPADAVDITRTAPMARVILAHGHTTLRDYFVLLKVDGEWRLANKTCSAVPAQ